MPTAPEFLSWDVLLAVHDRSIAQFGGLPGVRDAGALHSALAAAANTYVYGQGDIHDVAAAYVFHIAQSQGFLDGNKRAAVACAMVFLLRNGCRDCADEDAIYDVVIGIAERRQNKAAVAALLRRSFPRT